MKRAGLVGDPVSHSLSPRIFKVISRRLGRKLAYKVHRVKPPSLGAGLARLKAKGYSGINVTIPHKTAVLAHLSALTREARLIGAVNAVSFKRGVSRGHNTDAAGFSDALREMKFTVAGKDAVVFGAGGAARAVGFALGNLKARRVIFVARKPARGRALAAFLNGVFKQTRFLSGSCRPAALWVNATPLGMKGFPDRSPATGKKVRCGFAFDLVYGRDTAFLRKAKAAGAKTTDGKAMLAYQAVRSWEFWFGPLGAARRGALKNDIIEGI